MFRGYYKQNFVGFVFDLQANMKVQKSYLKYKIIRKTWYYNLTFYSSAVNNLTFELFFNNLTFILSLLSTYPISMLKVNYRQRLVY